MSSFNEAYLILTKAEFSDKPEKFLHKNSIEPYLTIGGVYRKYHQEAIDWGFIDKVSALCGYDIAEVNKLEKQKVDTKKKIPQDEFQKNAIKQKLEEIDYRLTVYNKALKRASKMLYSDNIIYKQVYDFFKREFWDVNRLDELHYQNTANEIFISAVHIGNKRAVKLAQKTAMVLDDGIIGNITLKALNNLSEQYFDEAFDKTEIAFYKENNGSSRYFKAFVNRAELV